MDVGEDTANTPSSRHCAIRLATMILMSATVLLLLLLTIEVHTNCARSFLNWGHIPMMGTLTLIVLPLFRTSRRISALTKRHGIAADYLFSAASVLALGAAGEALQAFTDREASIGDIGRNLFGIVSFLLLYATFDSALPSNNPLRLHKLPLRVLVVVSLLLSLWPSARDLLQVRLQRARMPWIEHFEEPLTHNLVSANDSARIAIEAAPSAWQRNQSRVCTITLPPQRRYGGIQIEQLPSGWQHYSQLCFETFLPAADSITMYLRLHDIHHNNQNSDRFLCPLTIVPGVQKHCIELSAVANAPQTRTMDLQNMATLILFAPPPAESCTVYFDNLRLY